VSSHAEIANQYALDVVEGRILACKWVKLACQRHLSDLDLSKSGEFPYVFDEAKAGRVCRFIEQLPHTKGDWAAKRENIKLEPWQCFIYSAVFGWVHRETRLRRFRIAYICVPRKNGKSILAAGTGNYMFAADGEFGAEVYAGATCQRQAWEVFRPAKLMVERTPRLKEVFGVDIGAKNLCIPKNGSRFEPVVGKPGDGSSPSCAIVDEYHEHRTDELVDTMRTGMGARKQPLLWIITTAGVNLAGPCYGLQSDVQKVLEGTIQREELFGIVYSVDESDDWTSEAALEKANPNYGVSVMPEFLLSEQAAAIQNSRKQNIFKTKHLNIWCGASVAWMNMQRWQALADPKLKLEDFAGEPAWFGCDLSSSIDITAAVIVFKRLIDGVAHFYVFGRYYLPRERAEDSDFQNYQQWLHDGHLIGIDGPTVDLSIVREDLLKDSERFDIQQIAFDPWAALETQQELQRELGQDKIISIPQNTKNLSYPMKQLEALVLEKRIHHDGNPALTWMMSNVVAHEDANENIFPRKEKPENKIDGAVALIMALSRAMADGGSQTYHEYHGF
jgi:phage terminase large subunit-like protein